MKKKLLSFMLAVAMLMGFVPQPAQARETRLWVDGKYVTGDVAPIIHKDRTLVPLRLVAEALGLEVEWNAESRQALIEMNGATYAFLPGKPFYGAGDTKVDMDTEAIIRHDRLFLPLRVIAEAMGKPVSWDAATYTAIVGTGYTPEKSSNTFQAAKVARVIDGDTIVLDSGQKVRLILVDTPETKHPKKGVEFYGREASAYTKKALEGKTVYLQKDVSEVDRYGRLLRYVWTARPSSNNPSNAEVKDKCFNAALLLGGYAKLSTFPPDVKYVDLFRSLERQARNNNAGLWAGGAAPAPAPAPKPTPKPAPAPRGPVGQGHIKGNRKSHIYHLPGGASYNKISPKNIVYFETEAQAQAAGYRRAKR